jgi:hypothetical protein
VIGSRTTACWDRRGTALLLTKELADAFKDDVLSAVQALAHAAVTDRLAQAPSAPPDSLCVVEVTVSFRVMP